MSAPSSRDPSLALALSLALGAWIAWILLRPDQALFLAWDDSWYYLEIGQNIASGRGSSFDGLQPTNGYHPLWMAVVVGLFGLGLPHDAALHAFLVLQLLTWGLVLWGVLRGEGRAQALIPLLLGLHPYVLKAVANAMESGAVAVTHGALLVLALRGGARLLDPGQGRLRLGMGALLALAFLARTDAGLLCVAVFAWALLAARRQGPGHTVRVFLELAALPALALGAFLLGNQLLFGHPMQVSGELKRLTPTGLRLLPMILGPALALALVLRRPRPSPDPLSRRLDAAPWYPAFLCLHLAYYLGLQSYPRQWYFVPEILWLLFMAPAGLASLMERARREAAPGQGERSAVLAALPLALILGAGQVLGLRAAADPGFLPVRLADRKAAAWADAHLPPDAVLGCWDAGLIGWTARLPVVNVDGVVASHAYLDALRTGQTAAYLRAMGITHVINHHERGPGGGPDELLASIGRFFGPDVASGAQVVYTESYQMTAGSNDKAHGQHEMATTILALPPG